MHLLPLTHDLFDPQLQLEAEPLSADASPWPCLGVPSIHHEGPPYRWIDPEPMVQVPPVLPVLLE